ncbi:hypothetical protein [Flexithrix dorotheae]|uniref:hypothetical protein n=1 Tax=Flexithrix dorotheae TaxID=70993 RepID=UPI00036D15D7|nr:hypothetical protein [Flexithrix dorotheae]
MDTRKLTRAQLQQAIEKNKNVLTEHFDLDYAKALNKHAIGWLTKYYFRAQFIGFDELPERNNPDFPLIFASNHSGMAFPWDGIIFLSGLFDKWDYLHNAPRPLTAPMLSQSTLMNPFLIRNLWKRVGSIDATTLNFETLMQYSDYNLMIYPEGVPGIGKGFNNKYKLQRLSTSMVRMSLKYKTDIILISSVNGEYINPGHYSNNWVNRIIQKIGIPFLPLGWLTLILLLQPWLFYYGLPAKLTFVMGSRIKPHEWTNKPFEEMERKDLEELRDKIHGIMQTDLDKAVRDYGKNPYQWKEHFKTLFTNWKKMPFLLPWAWPLLFSEFQRKYTKYGNGNFEMKLGFWSFFRILFRNPFIFAYFIPILGWIPVLLKGYKNAQFNKKNKGAKIDKKERHASENLHEQNT